MAFARLMRRCWTLAVVLVLALPGSSPAQRLPTTALPTHYSLHFMPDLETERFAARATIDVVVPVPTDRIVLHAVDLAIDDAMVVVAGHPRRAESRLEPDRDTLTLRLPQPIGPGDAQLQLTYTGVLTRERSAADRSGMRHLGGTWSSCWYSRCWRCSGVRRGGCKRSSHHVRPF